MKNKINSQLFSQKESKMNMPKTALSNRNHIGQKIYDFIPYLLSFMIPACILMVILAVFNVFPGDEKSILTMDLAAQYTDFFSYFKSFFNGENNLLYCLSQTLGNNMWGILPYYLLSPFNIILLFFTSSQLPTAIFIMTILKIGACGLTCYIFLNRIFHRKWSSLIFSVCYAFMSFNMVYLSHIMWLDGVILLPIIALGIHRIIDKKQPLCYIISLFFALVTNYYIGYMLCIFTVLYFLYRVLRSLPKESKLKYIWNKAKTYIVSSLIAGGLSAVVLLPAFMALSGGKSGGAKSLSFALNSPFLDIFGNLYTNMFEYGDLRDGLPNIFVGIFILVLVVLFFIHKTIDLRSKLLTGGIIAIFIASFNIVAFDLAWQGFTPPNWFTHRYAFIFSFLLITLAMESFQVLRISKPPIIRYSVTGIVMLVVTVLLSYYTGRFHSALKYALLDIGLIIIFFVLLYFVYLQNKKYLQTILTVGIGIICTGNISLNACKVLQQMPYENNSSYLNFHEDTTSVIEKAKELTGNSVSRIEKDYLHTFNDGMNFSYPGITHYSSNLKTNLVKFFEKTGYKTNNVFISNGQGNTLAFDSLYNIKYFISENQYFSQYEKLYEESKYTIYENPFALGLGFTIPTDVNTLELSDDNPFISQNNVFRRFVPEIEQDIFVPEELLNTQAENLNMITNDDGTIVLEKINTEHPASISYTYKRNEEKDPVYMCFGNSERNLKASIKLNGEDVFYDHYYHGVYYDYIHPVLILDDKGTYTITIELTEDSFELGTPYVYRQDMNIFEQYYNYLADGSYQANKNSSSSFSGQVTAKENERLFLSLPYENGWNIYIDGQKVETEKVFDTFLSVKIPKGTHTVELSFIPPGLIVGGIISGISIVALGGYLVWLYRKQKKNSN